MEPLAAAAAAARRRLIALAVSAIKPAPTGPTAMGLLGRDPAVVATTKCAVASGRYTQPSSSSSAADAYFTNGAASSSIKGTGGECLWSYGCAAASSDNHSCGAGCYPQSSYSSVANAYFSYGAACSRVKGTGAEFFGSYGPPAASFDNPSKATLGADTKSRGPGLLSSSQTITRYPSGVGVRYFSAKASPDGAHQQDPEVCKSVCNLDSTLVMEKLNSIDQKVTETGERHKIISDKVDGTVEACMKLRSDVEKLQEAQKGSGDWTSIKIFGKNLNLLAVGRTVADIWNKIP